MPKKYPESMKMVGTAMVEVRTLWVLSSSFVIIIECYACLKQPMLYIAALQVTC